MAMALGLASTSILAADVAATADIRGCEDPSIRGTATLVEQQTPEGIKQVTVDMTVTGLKDGKHAVHIHEFGKCQPCGDAGGHRGPEQ